MKRIIQIAGLFFFFLFSITFAQAQDRIYLKKGEMVEAKVTEIGVTEIKYRAFNNPDGPVYVVEKASLIRIEYQNGTVENYGVARIEAEEAFYGHKRRAGKISFLGPLAGHTNFVFEQNVRPGRSWEAKLSVIGLGSDQPEDARGVLGAVSYKFYKVPSFITADMKRYHLLQGGYIRPEIFFGSVSKLEHIFGSDGTRERSGVFGLLINLGKQWVFSDSFVLDLAGGVGYGQGLSAANYAIVEKNELGLAGSLTLNIGWVF